jgi:sortase A
MRLRKLVLVLAALALVATLAACGSLGQTSSGDGGGGQGNQQQGQAEELKEAPDEQVAPQQGSQEDSGEAVNAVDPPQDKTMKLTIPKMAEIEGDEIPTGIGTNEALFRDYAAVHLKYTGYPWQQEANVYIAGHRLGYDNTNSYRAFYDLEDLKNGDEVYIEDAEGRQYTYEVFDKFVVEPTKLSVLAPVEGKNIVSLQTCTLPDYTDRVIVRAELKDIKEA